MTTYTLKDNSTIILRSPQAEDAAAIVGFYNQIGAETDFLSFGGNEYPLNEQEQQAQILALGAATNSLMLLAVSGVEIAGIITISTSPKRKMRHVGVLGIGLSQKYWGKGLGRLLMEEALDWAKANSVITKVSLVTRADNQIAYDLYQKLGFKTEGIFKNDNYEHQQYFDSIAMALFFE